MSDFSGLEGRLTSIFRSRRPGRRRAASIMSILLVAASTKTSPLLTSTPSKKVSSWLTTLSVTPVESFPLLGARDSNSSKNIRQGEATSALAKTSRTAASEAPMNLSRSSGPLTLMKFRLLFFAMAEPRRVLPQPVGPNSMPPLGILMGLFSNILRYFIGFSKTSMSFAFALKRPPMSSHSTAVCFVSFAPLRELGEKFARARSMSACRTTAPDSSSLGLKRPRKRRRRLCLIISISLTTSMGRQLSVSRVNLSVLKSSASMYLLCERSLLNSVMRSGPS
mmetsp:Transcript_27980/g.52993  ORF Transcript_27980/g.52993 Transcript_27980/m.52993 type:complete len:280 (+) Transcript_27980:395-1234(+)